MMKTVARPPATPITCNPYRPPVSSSALRMVVIHPGAGRSGPMAQRDAPGPWIEQVRVISNSACQAKGTAVKVSHTSKWPIRRRPHRRCLPDKSECAIYYRKFCRVSIDRQVIGLPNQGSTRQLSRKLRHISAPGGDALGAKSVS